MEDGQFKKILEFFSLSFPGYRKVRKGAKKRLSRHMHELGCPTVEHYLNQIQKDQHLKFECRLALTVSISRFFRDRMVWDILRKKVLPELAIKGTDPIRIWSAGCARGEEVYSIKIVWEIAKKKGPELPTLVLLASDIHPEYLDKAQKGIYGRTSLKEVRESDINSFFHQRKGGKQFMVRNFLKQDIVWHQVDLCKQMPANDFDLIFLRNNVLTYLDGDLKETVFNNILNKLRPGGFLVKGAHEKIPESVKSLIPAFGQSNILRKIL